MSGTALDNVNVKPIVPAFLLFLMLLPVAASTEKIILSFNSTDYYFPTGTEAVVTLYSNNTYGMPISGFLSYTTTQQFQQGGFSYMSSNTRSSTLSIPKGESEMGLSFGSSDNPSELKVKFKFSYNDVDGEKVVDLPEITIHFITGNQNQQSGNQQNRQQAKAESKPASQQAGTSQQQSPAQNMLQQMFNQAFQNQQPAQQNAGAGNSISSRIQNNQLNQDSSALKKQMQEELQKKQQLTQEFAKQVARNTQFAKEHSKLLNEGYNLTDGSFNPSSNNTGSFALTYQDKTGKKATLQGVMQNGTLKQLSVQSEEKQKELLNALKRNSQYRKFREQLLNQGFSEQRTTFSYNGNRTEISVSYARSNSTNTTASIIGKFDNGSLKQVVLKNSKKKNENALSARTIILSLAGILLAAAMAFLLARKTEKKEAKQENPPNAIVEPEETPDYRKEALKMLRTAETLFRKGEGKEAYALAAYALRFYLNGTLLSARGKPEELTNEEVLSALRKREISQETLQLVRQCFHLCNLVEFARYKPNKKDFDRIIKNARHIIT